MSTEQLIEWALKAVMGLVVFMVTLLGRDLKRAETQAHERAESVVKETALMFDLRDQRIAVMEEQIERAREQSSKEAGRVTVKIAEHGDRLTTLETQMDALT